MHPAGLRPMAKLLPITGIAAAVLAAIATVADLTLAAAALPLLAVLAGVFAILEKGRRNLILGVVLIVAGLILAFLAIPGGVTRGSESGATQVAGSMAMAPWFALLGVSLASLAVVASRWGTLSPAWVGPASAGMTAVALAITAWKVSALGKAFADVGNTWPLYVAVVLFLGGGYASLVALRSPSSAPRPAPEPVLEAPGSKPTRRKAARKD